jgi:carbonic anhydrase/acetyltransferase-like protein (isoleucine patch superfamily)
MPLIALSGKKPKIHKSAYIAKSATIIGDVTIGSKSSIWPNAVLRGDVCKITIGNNSSIQDNATVHGDLGDLVRVGDGVTVGHNAILHGCTVLAAEIGEYCIVGAGAVVLDGVKVPEGTLVVGVPAKEAKKLGEKERKRIEGNALAYVKLIECYRPS